MIAGCLRREERAFRELFEALFPTLMPVCMRYAGREEEARSYLNTGFLKILTKLKKYRGEGSFEGWCKRVLVNSIIDEKRKSKRYTDRIELAGPEDLTTLANQQSHNWDPDAFTSDDIYACIRRLPELTAAVFNLYAVDGYQHKEIAKMLGIGLSASKWHYASAKRQLRQMLEALDREPTQQHEDRL